MRVAIIGAGIGGLTTAIALRKKGFEAAVYERAASFGEVGTGITLSPNATAVMRELDVLDRLEEVSQRLEHARFARPDGSIVAATAMAPIEKALGVPMLGIHRARLHEVLAHAANEEHVHCDQELVGLEQHDDGVVARFANGSQEVADVVVGADGLKSTVRLLAFNEALALRSARQQCWRGVVPISKLPSYPEADLVNATEYLGLGARFGTVPIGQGQLYWYAPLSDSLVTFEADDLPAFRDAMSERMNPLVREILDATEDAAIVPAPLGDRLPCEEWHRGRVVLLGDSVHSTTPNMGQGACMAIESAWVLAECLAETEDHRVAFQNYQDARAARTRMVTSRSWRIGRLAQTQNRLLATVRNAGLRIAPESATRNALISMFAESPAP